MHNKNMLLKVSIIVCCALSSVRCQGYLSDLDDNGGIDGGSSYSSFSLGKSHSSPKRYAVHKQVASPQASAWAGSDWGHYQHVVDYHGHPKYEFKYAVADHHTGDHKQHHEQRDGDAVKGHYSLHDPDGTIRTVKYYADHKHGFNAKVIKSGHAVHPRVVHKLKVHKRAQHHSVIPSHYVINHGHNSFY